MAEENVQYYLHSREQMLTILLPLLKKHLPSSNSMYYRLQAPFNDKHSLIAATFPPAPFLSMSTPEPPEIWTILFSDRSQDANVQVRLFSSEFFDMTCASLSAELPFVIRKHVSAALVLISDIKIPEASNQPFKSKLSIGGVSQSCYEAIYDVVTAKGHPVDSQTWRLWTLPLTTERCLDVEVDLPNDFTYAVITDTEIADVIATSKIRRKAENLLLLPNIAICDHHDVTSKVVAWAFIGADGALSTLFVKEEYRGRGLAKCIAMEIVRRFGRNEFAKKGFPNETGWIHTEITDGLVESEAVMRFLGAEQMWPTWNIYLDLDN